MAPPLLFFFALDEWPLLPFIRFFLSLAARPISDGMGLAAVSGLAVPDGLFSYMTTTRDAYDYTRLNIPSDCSAGSLLAQQNRVGKRRHGLPEQQTSMSTVRKYCLLRISELNRPSVVLVTISYIHPPTQQAPSHCGLSARPVLSSLGLFCPVHPCTISLALALFLSQHHISLSLLRALPTAASTE